MSSVANGERNGDAGGGGYTCYRALLAAVIIPTTVLMFFMPSSTKESLDPLAAEMQGAAAPLPLPQDVPIPAQSESSKCPMYRCFEPHCMEENGKCVDNPFYVPPKPKPVETDCRRIRKGLTTGDDSDKHLPSAMHGPIKGFKRLTNWMFRRWEDWTGDCVPPAEFPNTTSSLDPYRGGGSNYARTTAMHSKKHKRLYRMTNICIRPHGSLVGYKPYIEPYDGQHETWWRQRVLDPADQMPQFKAFLRNIHSLSAPPGCFLDTKVILMPIMDRVSSLSSVIHWAGSLLRLMESAFDFRRVSNESHSDDTVPQLNPSDVVVAYVALEHLSHKIGQPPQRLRNNMLNFVYQLISDKWFSFWGNPQPGGNLITTLGDEANNHVALNTPVCFREVFVYFNCLTHECDGARDTPGRQLQFSLLAPRTPRDKETMTMVTEGFRQCVGYPARHKSTSLKQPRVLLSVNGKRRRFTHQPSVISALGRAVTNAGGTMDVIEPKDHGLHYLIQLYSRADVVIGLPGAGLFWSIFQPAGGVVVELNHWPIGLAENPGVNRNTFFEYGGNAYSADLNHVLFPKWQRRLTRRSGSDKTLWDYDLPAGAMNEILRVAMCLLEKDRPGERPSVVPGGGGHAARPTSLSLNKACSVDRQATDALTQQWIQDADATSLKNLVRYLTFPMPDELSRQFHKRHDMVRSRLLFYQHPVMHAALRALREQYRTTRVLIIPTGRGRLGGLDGFDYREVGYSAVVEAAFLRNYIHDPMISVASLDPKRGPGTTHIDDVGSAIRSAQTQITHKGIGPFFENVWDLLHDLGQHRCLMSFDPIGSGLKVTSVEDCNRFGTFDLVIIAIKAPSIAEVMSGRSKATSDLSDDELLEMALPADARRKIARTEQTAFVVLYEDVKLLKDVGSSPSDSIGAWELDEKVMARAPPIARRRRVRRL